MSTLILALDVEPKEARDVIRDLKSHVQIFKIGSRLFTALGPQVIDWVHESNRRVFLDLKFHDIPLTVRESCRNAARMKVWGMTIHTSGGFAMMRGASEAVRDESFRLGTAKPLLFGVTVLTSLSQHELKEAGVTRNLRLQVKSLAQLARKSGLDGVVASGNEIETVRRACGKDFLMAVPGLRFDSGPSSKSRFEDQKRVVTPQKARSLGAQYLIVGRPVLEANDRIGELKKMEGLIQ